MEQDTEIKTDEPPQPTRILFGDLLAVLTPRLWVTRALIVANLLVFAAMGAAQAVNGGSPISPSAELLMAWGNFAPRTTQGEWWRLLTSMFVHAGLLHIALNMWVLYDAGSLLERLVGNVGFILLYFVSGLVGSLASSWWHPYTVSVGASGAVFGVIGGLIGFLAWRRDIPLGPFARIRNSAIAFVGYNIVFGVGFNFFSNMGADDGATRVGIDMAAHLGGLVAGILCGLVLRARLLPPALNKKGRPRRDFLLALLGALVVLGLGFAIPASSDLPGELEQLAAAEKRSRDALLRLIAARPKASSAAWVEQATEEVLTPWRKSAASFAEATSRVRANDRWTRLRALLLEYTAAQSEAWELTIRAVDQQDDALAAQAQAKEKAARAIGERFGTVARGR